MNTWDWKLNVNTDNWIVLRSLSLYGRGISSCSLPISLPPCSRQSQVPSSCQRSMSRSNVCHFQTKAFGSQCTALFSCHGDLEASCFGWQSYRMPEAWTVQNHLERSCSRESPDLEFILHDWEVNFYGLSHWHLKTCLLPQPNLA